MNYREYTGLLERYNEVDRTEFDSAQTGEGVIRRLAEVSREKKRIKTESNAIIREYIEKYERDPGLLDGEAEKLLQDFFALLMQKGQCLDTPIALRISRLLLSYYQGRGDLEKTVMVLERCAVFDIIMKEHLDDYEGSAYPHMAERYLADFDRLSEGARRALVNCWLLSVINRKDMTFGLRKYRQIRVRFEEIRKKAGADFMAPQYVLCRENVLGFTLEACRRAEHRLGRKDAGAYESGEGTKEEPPLLDIEKERAVIEELARELSAALKAENVKSVIADRVVAKLYCVQAAYHLREIDLEELLRRMEELSHPEEDYNAMEQCSALFTANAYYMDYLSKCSNCGEKYILDKCTEILEHVLAQAGNMERYLGGYQTNYCVLMLVNAASGVIDFDAFKSTVLSATVYANKALYVHTMMVREICGVILEYILEHDPRYLDGVGGYGWEECRGSRAGVLELMEKCALFHDIGKYFCLDYVSNSSRNLTDDEFDIVKAHTTNFSKIYQGKMDSQVACVRDCALLHHLWYNEQGGYPRARHTQNKPFVNIISIADSLDAATDNIGRPYGQGKTLDQMLEEFDGMRDGRYSGYICALLHVAEVKRKIEHILQTRRKEIYCEIYLASDRLRKEL